MERLAAALRSQLAIKPNTVVRGGFGIFYTWPYETITSNGFSQTTTYVQSLNGNETPTELFL